VRGKFRLCVLVAVLSGAFAAAAAAASSPSVTTGGHKSVTQTSAVLLGTVNPNGTATSYFFQWGLTSSYGYVGHVHHAGSGTKAVNVSGNPTSLIPGTVYHYRLVALNKDGGAAGRDRTFKTAGPPPPAASTGAATLVGRTGATLTGVIDPNGGATTWRFEYGLSSAYSSYTVGGTLPAGKAPVVVTQTLAGLAPGTIFHYRLVAFHGSVSAGQGADAVFMTEPSRRPTPHIVVRTTPRHDRRRPFTFTTSGRITPPRAIPAQFGCTGWVAIRLFLGRRDVSFILVPLQPDCTFSGQTVLRRKPGRGARNRIVTLRVAVRYRGNGYLQTVAPRSQFITLG